MRKIFKYGVFPVVIFLFLLVVTVMLMPVLINVQKYVPEIEKSISKAAGRPFSIGSDVAISFFPRLSLTFSDLRLGNPKGFVSDALVKIDAFEAQVKLLPLLKKEIQISRFVVSGLEVNLETSTEGKVNWGILRMPRFDALQDNILCTLLAVTDGRLNWIDRKNHVRHSVEDLMLLLNNVQADRPIAFDFKASYQGKPLALEGNIGPLRPQQGQETLSADIGFRLVESLKGQVRAKVVNWQSAPVYDVTLKLPFFSPKQLSAALGLAFPLETADPTTFQGAELDLAIKGGRNALTIEKCFARLDDTKLILSGEVKNFEKPEMAITLDLDRLDLDRYLPGEHRDTTNSGKAEPSYAMENAARGLVYRWSRNVALAGDMKIEALKAYGTTVSAAQAKLTGKDGIFTLDQASMKLYGGQLQGNLVVDFAGEKPKMRLVTQAQGVDAETMGRDVSGREILTGTLASDLVLEYSGLSAGARKGLSGEATITLVDGAVLGADLHQSLQRRELVEAGPGGDPSGLRTDFSELKGAVVIEGGRLSLREGTLTSPAAAMTIGGGVDIPGRTWNLQVAPQGTETKSRKGKSSLPLTLVGTFERLEQTPVDKRPQPVIGATEGAKANVANLVDEKIPSPVDADVKDLVGKPLIDPAIVAQRFHLQRETIRRGEIKKQLQVGSGKIRINALQEASSLQ